MATVIGEAILSVLIESLIKQLSSSTLLLLDMAFKGEVLKGLQKWQKLLPKLQAVVEDAEDKQLTDRAIKLWLEELKGLVFDAEDLLDEFAFESLKKELKDRDSSSSSKCHAAISRFVSKLSPYSFVTYRDLGSKVRDITCRFEKVTKERSDLDLRENSSSGIISSASSSRRSYVRLESTSLVNEVEIFGREKEKEDIVKLVLTNEGYDGDRLSVIPIVGMGGLGKTTLAQLVFNDVEVSNSFELKAWCCVSEDFDIVRITNTILQAVSLESCNGDDLNRLQVKLRGTLALKKFLLVLDDVWNENYERWTLLCEPFHVVAPGSKVIVTTRNQAVAEIMGTVPIYFLQTLSFEDSFSLLAKHALGEKDFSGNPKLMDVAKGIVRKCAGLPLAVKTLGGLLRAKPDIWERILNSELWDLPEEKSGILPALRLSYCHLPSHLKNCFAFCSIFPKGFEFCRDELVLLWMAEGFSTGRKNKLMEDLYFSFDELLSRSFFQHSSRNASKFLMHDLINDLAKSAAGDLCINFNGKNGDINIFSLDEKTRHFSFSRRTYELWHKFKDLDHLKNLRTFIALPTCLSTGAVCCFLNGDLLCRALPKLRVLRVLSLSGYCNAELPSAIGDLKHLRYINLSHSRIQSLPESVCGLLNLETLILHGCQELIELPEKIDNLISLCYLDIAGTWNLREMPSRIGDLTGLQKLSKVIVGKDKGMGIRELNKFANLEGKLSILELKNVTDIRQAVDANLRNKRKLVELELEWNHNFHDIWDTECEVNVLNSLQPYTSLKKLKISSYGGSRFPSWIGDPSFTNMVHLKLSKCRKCRFLPPLGELPELKSLCIESMDEIKEVGQEFYGVSTLFAKSFSSLKMLTFKDMIEWEHWMISDGDGANEETSFPVLTEFILQNCPKLVGKLPSRLSSLQRLTIQLCPLLRNSLTILPSLHEMKLEKCKEVTLSSMADVTFAIMSYREKEQLIMTLWEPKILTVSNCNKLTFLCRKETGLSNLFDLEILKIKDCQVVASFTENKSAMNCSLPELDLLRNVDCHSYGLLGLVSLKYLSIESCLKLVSIPGPNLFSSLKHLVLKGCKALESLPDNLMESPQRISEGGESSSLKNRVLCQTPQPIPNCLTTGSYGGYTCLLEELEIVECPLLRCFPRGRLPMSLNRLSIQDCTSLHSLPEGIMHNNDDARMSRLEQLEIIGCPSLRVFPIGKLPSRIKTLKIWECCGLEPLSDIMLCDNTSLEIIDIVNYEKLVRLPESLSTLMNLTILNITNCAGLESFLEDAPSLPKLRTLSINDCAKLKKLPSQMQSLSSLQELTISGCASLVLLPKGRFLPPNLISLEIWDCENLRGLLSDWNLNCLTSLRELSIAGRGFIDVTSFPDSCLLPANLNFIAIRRLLSLKSISEQIKSLTNVEVLEIFDCPNLQSLPTKGLPPNLGKFSITRCPLLAKRCIKKKGTYWSTISSIPCIEIDGNVM